MSADSVESLVLLASAQETFSSSPEPSISKTSNESSFADLSDGRSPVEWLEIRVLLNMGFLSVEGSNSKPSSGGLKLHTYRVFLHEFQLNLKLFECSSDSLANISICAGGLFVFEDELCDTSRLRGGLAVHGKELISHVHAMKDYAVLASNPSDGGTIEVNYSIQRSGGHQCHVSLPESNGVWSSLTFAELSTIFVIDLVGKFTEYHSHQWARMTELGWLSDENYNSPWTYINVELSPIELVLPSAAFSRSTPPMRRYFSEGVSVKSPSLVVNYSFGGYRQSVLKLIGTEAVMSIYKRSTDMAISDPVSFVFEQHISYRKDSVVEEWVYHSKMEIDDLNFFVTYTSMPTIRSLFDIVSCKDRDYADAIDDDEEEVLEGNHVTFAPDVVCIDDSMQKQSFQSQPSLPEADQDDFPSTSIQIARPELMSDVHFSIKVTCNTASVMLVDDSGEVDESVLDITYDGTRLEYISHQGTEGVQNNTTPCDG